MSELQFVDWLRGRAGKQSASVALGIGDDAAVLQLADQQLIVSTDMLMDGVDFKVDECNPERIGRKALAVNLSDLAAMAARPIAAFVSLALPRDRGMLFGQRLYEGLFALADEFDVAIAGGDTNSWDQPMAINVCIVGEATSRGPLRRDGARVGDAIVVTGCFGGSILGRHFDFTPRVNEALAMHEQYELHAGIDVSDGLSLDLSRLAAASNDGAALNIEAIPIADDARRLAAQNGTAELDHALGDGEDFELILAMPVAEAQRLVAEQPLDVPLTIIGEFIEQPGLWRRDEQGALIELTPRGYEHK